ncbi:hypothetical protein [Candidatus Nitrosotenuis cloacae]|uniref:hypothetical protein n=1 Tax=Candidatus Nitrosotenuis cloacae TaxID=1603555 RepID=UPI00227ED589|nr:hypothetical protein [Candidatus Nitrosotenuis cloacae]
MMEEDDIRDEIRIFKKISPQQIMTTKHHYNMGSNSEQTSSQPGTPSRKTVQRLFKYWIQQYKEKYEQSTLNDRQITAKGRAIAEYEHLRYKWNYALNEIETICNERKKFHEQKMLELKNSGRFDEVTPYKPDMALEAHRRLLLLDLVKLRDRQAGIEMAPTSYETNDEKILETLKKRAKNLGGKSDVFNN